MSNSHIQNNNMKTIRNYKTVNNNGTLNNGIYKTEHNDCHKFKTWIQYHSINNTWTIFWYCSIIIIWENPHFYKYKTQNKWINTRTNSNEYKTRHRFYSTKHWKHLQNIKYLLNPFTTTSTPPIQHGYLTRQQINIADDECNSRNM